MTSVLSWHEHTFWGNNFIRIWKSGIWNYHQNYNGTSIPETCQCPISSKSKPTYLNWIFHGNHTHFANSATHLLLYFTSVTSKTLTVTNWWNLNSVRQNLNIMKWSYILKKIFWHHCCEISFIYQCHHVITGRRVVFCAMWYKGFPSWRHEISVGENCDTVDTLHENMIDYSHNAHLLLIKWELIH